MPRKQGKKARLAKDLASKAGKTWCIDAPASRFASEFAHTMGCTPAPPERGLKRPRRKK